MTSEHSVLRAEIAGAFATGALRHRVLFGGDFDRFTYDNYFTRFRPPLVSSAPSDRAALCDRHRQSRLRSLPAARDDGDDQSAGHAAQLRLLCAGSDRTDRPASGAHRRPLRQSDAEGRQSPAGHRAALYRAEGGSFQSAGGHRLPAERSRHALRGLWAGLPRQCRRGRAQPDLRSRNQRIDRGRGQAFDFRRRAYRHACGLSADEGQCAGEATRTIRASRSPSARHAAGASNSTSTAICPAMSM